MVGGTGHDHGGIPGAMTVDVRVARRPGSAHTVFGAARGGGGAGGGGDSDGLVYVGFNHCNGLRGLDSYSVDRGDSDGGGWRAGQNGRVDRDHDAGIDWDHNGGG